MGADLDPLQIAAVLERNHRVLGATVVKHRVVVRFPAGLLAVAALTVELALLKVPTIGFSLTRACIGGRETSEQRKGE